MNKKKNYNPLKGELKAIDLFSGCGGMTLGLKQAGFSVIGAVDIDKLATETYRLNHAEVKIWESDIKKLDCASIMAQLKLRAGDLDLLAGCPPCQGFSSVRTLNGGRVLKDRRNDLVYEFLRFAKALRPKSLMMENVPGLLKDRRSKKLKLELEKIGYTIEIGVRDAADYGVPQRRKRFILLGALNGAIAPAPKAELKKTVRDTISKLPKPGLSGDPCHDLSENRSSEILKIIKLIPKDGGSRRDLGKRYQLQCHLRAGGFNDVYGRMAWDKVSPTITGGCISPSKGRFLHPVEHRAITLREAALLQTFPRSYKFSLSKGKFHAAQMIGNALPPAFIKSHAIQIKKALIGRDF